MRAIYVRKKDDQLAMASAQDTTRTRELWLQSINLDGHHRNTRKQLPSSDVRASYTQFGNVKIQNVSEIPLWGVFISLVGLRHCEW